MIDRGGCGDDQPRSMLPASVTAPHPAWERIRPLVGGILALAAAMGIGRFAYTPILPAMLADRRLDAAQAGLLAAANYAGYLAGAVLVAALVTPSAQAGVLRASAVAVAVTTALMAMTGPAAWGVVRFLAGVAGAGVFVLASGLVLDDLRRQGRASLSGWLFSGVGLGIAISGFVVRATGGALGWRGDWAVLALVAAVAIYPAWRWLPAARSRSAPTRSALPTEMGAPPRGLVLLFAAYFFEGVGYIVSGTFLSAIVERTPGSEGLGASVWIVAGLAAIPAGVLWSAAARRVGYARALAGAYLLQACGIVLPAVGGGAPAFASAALFGGTFVGITTLTLTLAGQLTPHRSASLIGALTAVYGLGQVIGPVLAGLIADRAEGFGPALAAAAVIVLLGGSLAAAIRPA